jgi:hypothetical protein
MKREGISPGGVSAVVDRVARRLHRSVLLAAALWTGVALASILLTAWLWAGPEGWSQGSWGPLLLDVFLLAALVAGASLLLRIRRRWLAEARIARCVEDAAGLHPGTVVGSLELARSLPVGVSAGLARHAEQSLLRRLDHPEDHLAGPMRRPIAGWTRGALAGLAVCAPALVLAAVLAPSRSLSAWSGLSSPVFLLAPPSLPPIEVTPGDREVLRGEAAQVSVRAPGRTRVTLHWQTAGEVPRSSATAVDADERATFDFPAVTAPVRYWAAAPDGARSDEFHLTPIDPLFVSDLRLVLEFPEHTSRLPEEHRGDVAALSMPAGTRIRVDGRASRELGEGALGLRGGSEVEALTVTRAGFSASWVPRASGVWEWSFRDADGAPAELVPRPLEITLVPDAPPLVWFSYPGEDGTLPMTLRQPLVIEVEDDYGVAAMELIAYRLSGGERGEDVVQAMEIAGARRAVARPVLDLGSWGLLPGDEIRYRARVTDNAPSAQTAVTQEWVLRMPGAGELRRGAQETLEEATRRIEELAREAERAAEQTRSLERQAAAERGAQQRGRTGGASGQESGGFQQREDVRQALERQEGLSSELDALREQLQAMSEAMREAGLADPGLRSDLEELQRLLEEISSPELRERLREMNRALEGMDAQRAQEMLARLSESQDAFREMLESSIERFRRAAVEQDFRATTSEAEELARLERALADALREGGDTELRAQQQADIQRRAEDVDAAMQALEERLAQLGEEQAAAGVEEGRERAAEARQAMARAEQQARAGQNQQAGEQADRAASAMQRAAEDLRDARQGMSDQRSEAVRETLEGAADEALALARRQSEIRDRMRNASTEEMAGLRGDVSALLQGLRSMSENVQSTMQQSGSGSPDVSEEASRAQEALERTIESMAQRPTAGPAPAAAAEAAVDALNQLALSALAGARQAGQEGQQGPGQEQQGDLNQQLDGLAQQQGQLNSQAGEIAPMQLGQQALQNQLRELAEGQRNVAGELGRLSEEPGSDRALGDLEALAQEALELARMLEGGRLDPETRRRQERLFHRLLDAGRSLEKEDEMSEQREARTAGTVEEREVQPLTAEAVGGIRYRLPDAAVLQRLGPAERQLVIEYFERLNREAPRPPAGATPPAGAGGAPPAGGGPR